MVAKNIVGIAILFLNTAGLGYLIYRGILALVSTFSPEIEDPKTPLPLEKKEPAIVNDQIISDEEDLLKDMDLSDLDDLDLKEFD